MTLLELTCLTLTFVSTCQFIAVVAMRHRLITLEEILEEILDVLKSRNEKTVDFEADLTRRLEHLQRARFSQMRMKGEGLK